MMHRAGTQFGNYHLIRLLGAGSFGKVYLGEHKYHKTQVAIKLLPGLDNEDLLTFLNKAQSSRLKHPNIVPILDIGLEENSHIPFLVMEYAPGGSLLQCYPKGTRLQLPTIISYVKQIASALQYAHDKGLIHGDVKPANMLVRCNDEIFLSDFGIASLCGDFQRVQNAIGTVEYMAPEHLQGNPCFASDQYSLGIVVYEWLCGKQPFQGSPDEILHQHVYTFPPPLNKNACAVSDTLETVVLKALTKDQKHRFVSISAFAQALEHAVHEIDKTTAHAAEKGKPFKEALMDLSWLERTCLLLRADAGFSVAQIAEIVGESEREVYVSLKHGYEYLLETYYPSIMSKEIERQTSQDAQEHQEWKLSQDSYTEIDGLIRNLPNTQLPSQLQPMWGDQWQVDDYTANTHEVDTREVKHSVEELSLPSEGKHDAPLEIYSQEHSQDIIGESETLKAADTLLEQSSPSHLEKANEMRLAQEEGLVRQACQGDPKAFTKLYEYYIDPIYSYLYKRVKNIDDAEALTSETFTRAVEALMRGHYSWQAKPFGAWLYGIAANVLREHVRNLRDKSPIVEDLDLLLEHNELVNEEIDTADTLIQKEERSLLWQLITELPLADQSILVMRYVYELSYAKIAKRLGRSENACKQLHYRALKKLKLKVQEAGLWNEIRKGGNEHKRSMPTEVLLEDLYKIKS